jgi:hypothetical protein
MCGEHIKHISAIVKDADEIAAKASHIVTHMPTSLDRVHSITTKFTPDSIVRMIYQLLIAFFIAVIAVVVIF